MGIVIWGAIKMDGSKAAGSEGFQVSRQGPGQYLITFNPPFPKIPAIVGSQTNWGDTNENTLDNVVFPVVKPDQAIALTGATNGLRVDRNFSFIVAFSEELGVSVP